MRSDSGMKRYAEDRHSDTKELNKTFQFPPCAQVKLKPPSPLKITLPTGATLTAFSDSPRGFRATVH